MGELLGWLQQRLGLTWVDQAAPAPWPGAHDAPALTDRLPPPADALQSLAELVRLGYLRGIQKKLDAIEAAHPPAAAALCCTSARWPVLSSLTPWPT